MVTALRRHLRTRWLGPKVMPLELQFRVVYQDMKQYYLSLHHFVHVTLVRKLRGQLSQCPPAAGLAARALRRAPLH